MSIDCIVYVYIYDSQAAHLTIGAIEKRIITNDGNEKGIKCLSVCLSLCLSLCVCASVSHLFPLFACTHTDEDSEQIYKEAFMVTATLR